MNERPVIAPFPLKTALALPAGAPPLLCVVIDTEEEFDWHAPFNAAATATENIRFQPLAQTIFERFGVVPTYVIDYPVASSPTACSVLRSFMQDGRCEIGAHLHPWVNPPASGPVDTFHSYPGNLPPEDERAKLDALTARIADAFGSRPVVYKAGRYGVGRATEEILVNLGYKIDVSLVPHSDFSADGGPNFRRAPDHPFLSERGIVALPLSVHFLGKLARLGPHLYPALTSGWLQKLHAPGIAARTGLLERLRLSPEGHLASDMVRQTRAALARGERFFMLTYHSSSLLPGASPYVRTEQARAEFLERLETYLRFFTGECGGRAMVVTEAAAALQAAASEKSSSGVAAVTAGEIR